MSRRVHVCAARLQYPRLLSHTKLGTQSSELSAKVVACSIPAPHDRHWRLQSSQVAALHPKPPGSLGVLDHATLWLQLQPPAWLLADG